ncbi:uncharacterized protein A4U43_C01F14800 [Asparagus officinalis]|uniref:Uncharacterized protein n=1 Tax=Asparagus officinalis TaxID=4686 RepID=A0A5P1FPZ6_ASPOF|nr:uncharacterized protein A4U43_C01F14800 [Asparagus officinalis]
MLADYCKVFNHRHLPEFQVGFPIPEDSSALHNVGHRISLFAVRCSSLVQSAVRISVPISALTLAVVRISDPVSVPDL